MNLHEIEQNVANLDLKGGFEFIYDLLLAYGVPKASISRLKSGSHDRSKRGDELLWKGRLYYRHLTEGEDPYVVIDDASKDEAILKERPRFLVVRNNERLLAIDRRVETTIDIAPHELTANSAFFLPWAGIEKTQLEMTNYADVRAAEKMARLYDEVVKHNELSAAEQVHDLNVFFSRLLFCFFAEDTGVFQKGAFTNALGSLTEESGEDTAVFLDALFDVLNLPENARDGVPAHFLAFGYVNGKLFARRSSAPKFSAKARKLILECGTLNWSQINPDIFGSMIQAVVHPTHREGLGMHYTSVENIMRVIRPLFLDELHAAFDSAQDDLRGLERLLKRISAIRVFDPACGSGNFLVISYKELRKLEHRILQRIADLDKATARMFSLSKVKLENFCGIEIDDFAHEVAVLSLWLAKHQMNVDFHALFGVEIALIPLKDTGNIVCGNAARLDWDEICAPTSDEKVVMLGNPPYRGAALQTDENREDLAAAFGERPFDRRMDYVSAWFIKGAEYVARHNAKLGFVSTNSVTQGAHVEMLWPLVLAEGVDISFAHTSFRWTNQARGNAGVTVVVIGLERDPKKRVLFSEGTMQCVDAISPYLTASDGNVIVGKRRDSVSGLPKMDYGSKPVDGGALSLSGDEADELVAGDPEAKQFLRRYMGSAELIRGIRRHCIWITGDRLEEALKVRSLADRVERVRQFRSRSQKASTRNDAARAWQFQQIRHKETPSIIVPRHSAARREYVPMGFLNKDTIISDAANAIYDAELWVFGLVQSRIHMTWMRAIAGRLKTDYRYSAVLVYNTFPVPDLTEDAKKGIASKALQVLEARELYADRTLGELYDPDLMPAGLRKFHSDLDQLVDELYSGRAFSSDEERLSLLFEMYAATTPTEGAAFVA